VSRLFHAAEHFALIVIENDANSSISFEID
jgi:hypothetical protein